MKEFNKLVVMRILLTLLAVSLMIESKWMLVISMVNINRIKSIMIILRAKLPPIWIIEMGQKLDL